MVSHPSSTESVEDVPDEVTKVGYFDASQEYYLSYDYDPANFTFTPGEGYWLYAEEQIEWAVQF